MLKTAPTRMAQIFAVTALLWVGSVQAADPPQTPTTPPPGINLVEAQQVQELQAKGAVLVDARKAAEYAEGSIKGAISVPYDPEVSAKDVNFDPAVDKFDLSQVADKNQTYVVFCNAGSCWKSFKLVAVMARNGYKNLNWYRSGFPDWKARNLPIE